jgi:hypothetical protein
VPDSIAGASALAGFIDPHEMKEKKKMSRPAMQPIFILLHLSTPLRFGQVLKGSAARLLPGALRSLRK